MRIHPIYIACILSVISSAALSAPRCARDKTGFSEGFTRQAKALAEKGATCKWTYQLAGSFKYLKSSQKPAHGTIATPNAYTFTYTPSAGFSGTDTFIMDAGWEWQGGLRTGKLEVTINVVDKLP